MTKFVCILIHAFTWMLICVGLTKDMKAAENGHLVIVGGGLRPDNRTVFEALIEYAGGAEKARFVVLPTASVSTQDSYDFCKYLASYGVSPERSEVLLVTEKNAATSVADAQILEKVRRASGVFLSGGDQRRLVRLLTRADGGDTPLLTEIRNVHARGGVIGGTSAGASAQSATMLAVSGLHDRLIDEGLDTLDFGITSHPDQRGLLLTGGFGFFKAGIIDQHFTQFRGRLGRLTRATADSGVPLGFGIDENTALLVASDGPIRIAGAGSVTIIKPGEARGEDGPCGYTISGVNVSMLSDGDTFDPASGAVTISPAKPPLVAERLEYDGNFLINDIAASGALPFALVAGLAENSRPVQAAISVKYHADAMHGYRFVFRKRPTSRAYGGILDEKWTYSLLDVHLDISPIANGLRPAATQAPRDLADGGADSDELPNSQACAALAGVAFRGLLPANQALEFRPHTPITRGEFACALARSVHLTQPTNAVSIDDIDLATMDGEEIIKVIAAGMMYVKPDQKFHTHLPLSPADAATGLRKLVELGAPIVEPHVLSEIDELAALPQTEVSRWAIGVLLHAILKLPN